MRKLPFVTTLLAVSAFGFSAAAQDAPPPDPAPTEGAAPVDSPAEAAAEDAGAAAFPVRYARRPLTLPAMMLSPELGFSVSSISLGPASATIMNLRLGAEFGVIDDLTVEATPLAFSFGDADGYGIATLGATYRFVNSDAVEVGARLRLGINDNPDILVNAGVPIRIHGGDVVRVDTGAFFNLLVPDGGDAAPGLATLGPTVLALGPGIPLDASFSLVDMVYAGVNSGFGIADFSAAGDTIFVPLGFHVGGTVPIDEKPVADITAGFGFPYFVNTLGGDAVTADIWALTVQAKGFLPL